MIKLFGKIEERENKVFAFIPGLKSVVFPLTHIIHNRPARDLYPLAEKLMEGVAAGADKA